MSSALHDHLIRLFVWAMVSLVVGLVRKKTPFGAMITAWGFVDAIIALASLRGGPPGAGFRAFLAFNLGLDLGYVGVGAAMALLAGERPRVRGFGQAVVVQGAALLALDAILWLQIA